MVAAGLPLLDHSALLSLRITQNIHVPAFPLRLLDASSCRNATSQGLGEAVAHLPFLVYLDLSGTSAVRDRVFLWTLRLLPQLRVLKLRNVYLRDEDLEVIAKAIQIRIRSLDVRGNYLTDQSVPVLLGNCFCAAPGLPHTSRDGVGYHSGRPTFASGDSELAYKDYAALEELQEESYDHQLARRLTNGDVQTSSFDVRSRSGITHLRISDNQLSVDGLAGLIHSRQLCVLDAGSPSTVEELNRIRLKAANYLQYPDIQPTALAHAQRLIPALERYGQALTYLRIDHAIVSEMAPQEEAYPVAFYKLNISDTASEAVYANPLFGEPQPPPYVISDTFTSATADNASGLSNDSSSFIQEQRAALRFRDTANSRGLLPCSLPKVRTLVLTQVPCYEKHRKTTNALINFIHDCSQEAKLADVQAQMLALPRPKAGEIRTSRRKETTEQIFRLKTIVLEMAPANQVLASTLLPSQNVKPSKYVHRTKSSTEDQDSEAFWAAAEDDFSFFDDNAERDQAATATAQSEPLKLAPFAEPGYRPIMERRMRVEELVDVVTELAKFRRERKVAYEDAYKKGKRYVDGYWPGDIHVVRPYAS